MHDVQRGLTSACPELMVCASGSPALLASNGVKVVLRGVWFATLWPERAGAVAGQPFTVAVDTTDNAGAGSTIVLRGTFGVRYVYAPPGTSSQTVML